MSGLTPHRLSAVIFLMLLTSAVAAAQFGSLSGPVLGYVFDRDAGKLRPVRGILGSATIGSPLESEILTSGVLTLDSSHVVASSESSAELLALSLEGSNISRLVIADVPASPSSAAASPRGTAAAFYYSQTQLLRIVTGLPKEPRLTGLVQLDRPLTHLAINDDGTLLLFAVAGQEGDSLHLWSALHGSASFVTSAGSISGIAMTRNGDAIVTDRAANEVFAIWNAQGGGIRRLLADVAQGVSGPTGVAVSSDGRIYVANAGSGTAMVLDSNGRLLRNHTCACTISGFSALRDSVFRLTDRIDQTTFLLDANNATEERILFVPPPQE